MRENTLALDTPTKEIMANKITIIDSICGSGKTTWTINYFNNAWEQDQKDLFDGKPSAERRFLYIAPFLEEADRVSRACPDLRFKDPQPLHGRKLWHLEKLIENNESICTTHSLFTMLSRDIYDLLKERNYQLVIDETIGVVDVFKALTEADRNDLFGTGRLYVGERGRVCWDHARYPELYKGRFEDVMRLADNGNLIAHGTDRKTGLPNVLIWEFPAPFLACFSEVVICTYLFEGSPMSAYLRAEGLSFNMKAVRDGQLVEWIDPEREASKKAELRSLVTIYEGAMNRIGDNQERSKPLSSRWFDRGKKHTPEVLKNLRSSAIRFFEHISKTPSRLNGWTTFKKVSGDLKGPRYGRGFLPVNCKATNKYRDKTAMAYLANIFYNPTLKGFFTERGIPIYDDLHALSELVQWVFRSAIRDSKPIHLFIPSQRMRELFKKWLNADDTAALIKSYSAQA
jgi:hypothetical protein